MKENFKFILLWHSTQWNIIKMIKFSSCIYLSWLYTYTTWIKCHIQNENIFTNRIFVLMFSLLLSHKNLMTMINMLTLTLHGMTGCITHNKSGLAKSTSKRILIKQAHSRYFSVCNLILCWKFVVNLVNEKCKFLKSRQTSSWLTLIISIFRVLIFPLASYWKIELRYHSKWNSFNVCW